MFHRTKHAIGLAVLALALACPVEGEEEEGEDFDLPDLTLPTVLWDKSLNLRLGAGFKDNVLLSSGAGQHSPFIATGLDAMLLRVPLTGPQAWLFISGDDYRYLRNIGVDKEQTLVGLGKLQHRFRSDWEWSLAFQYLYQNQVIDVSVTEAELTTLQLKGHSLKATPMLERKLGERYKLQLETPVHRQFLQRPLDDYWEVGAKTTLERAYGNRSAALFSYAFDRRLYDERRQFSPAGEPLPGTSLAFQQHEIEAGNRHHFDQKRRWRSDTRLGFRLSLDNGSGFFDYDRYRLSQQLRYSATGWLVRGGVRVNHYRYPLQTVALDDPSRRRLTSLTFSLRGEKTVIGKLKVYAEYEREEFLSNRPSNEYRANTVLAGLDWEF